MRDSTLLKRVSLGIARAAITPGTRVLEVIPIESNGYLDGALSEEINTDMAGGGTDSLGVEYQTKITTSNSVTAIWYPGKSNAMSPPTITAGEQVILYRYADTDQYYWSAEGQSDHLRPTDTVSVGVSAKGEVSTDALNADNAYQFTMSSDQKKITLTTSQKNGEKCTYSAEFNMDTQFFEVKDSDGQLIQIDTATNSIALQNKDGSRVEMNGSKMVIEAPQEILIKTKSLKVETTTTDVAGSKSIKLVSSLVDLNGTTTKFSGNSMTFSYDSSTASSGNFNWGGTQSFVGTINHNGINIGSDHKHDGVQNGNGNTGTVTG